MWLSVALAKRFLLRAADATRALRRALRAFARVPPHLRACAALRKLAMTAIGWLLLPWAVVALVLVLRLPPDPSPATTRRLLATNEPASQPAHCADDDVTRQVLEALPHTAPLLRALASFHAVSAEYFPDLCPEER